MNMPIHNFERRLCSILAVCCLLTVMVLPCLLVGAQEPEYVTQDVAALEGTDTLANASKMSGYAGKIAQYQFEHSGNAVRMHYAWNVAGTMTPSYYGDLLAPWMSWKIANGANIEFLGLFHKDVPGITTEIGFANADNHFRFQTSVDGQTWTDMGSVTIDKIVNETEATAKNVRDEFRDVDLTGNWVGALYTFTAPATATAVRVVFPKGLTELSLSSGNHWLVNAMMMRTSGGGTPPPTPPVQPEFVTQDVPALEGTDTLANVSKMSGYAGKIAQYQFEHSGNTVRMHYAWNVTGTITPSYYGELLAPWMSWNITSGNKIEFLGLFHKDVPGITTEIGFANADNHFRIQTSVDGQTWTDVEASDLTIDKIVNETEATAKNVRDEFRDADLTGNWVGALYSFTAPATATAVRVVFPKGLTELSLQNGNHWLVNAMMMRATAMDDDDDGPGPVTELDHVVQDAAALDGTDTIKNLSKVYSYVGAPQQYQFEHDGNAVRMHYSWNVAGTLTPAHYGELAAPWLVWKINAGAKVEFLGLFHKDVPGIMTDIGFANADNHFRFQTSVDGQTWVDMGSVTIDKIVDETTATAKNVRDEFRDADLTGNWIGALYTFTAPETAIAVRVVFPKGLTELSLQNGNHWLVNAMMIRTEGGVVDNTAPEQVGIVLPKDGDPNKVTLDTNVLSGTDSIENFDKMSDWAGKGLHYQFEHSGDISRLHYSWNIAGTILPEYYGELAAPWLSWNVNTGADVQFLGLLHKNVPDIMTDAGFANADNHFRFQSSADGKTWVTLDKSAVTINKITTAAEASQHKVLNEFREGDLNGNWVGVLYSFTLPQNHTAVRVMFPKGLTELSLKRDNHWLVSAMMFRSTGGTAPTPIQTDKELFGADLIDLESIYVADSQCMALGYINEVDHLCMDFENMPEEEGAPVFESTYVTYRVKPGSSFGVRGVLGDSGRAISMRLRLYWSADNRSFTPLDADTVFVSESGLGANRYDFMSIVKALPQTAKYVKVELPIDYNYTGGEIPGLTEGHGGTLVDAVLLTGVYLDVDSDFVEEDDTDIEDEDGEADTDIDDDDSVENPVTGEAHEPSAWVLIGLIVSATAACFLRKKVV